MWPFERRTNNTTRPGYMEKLDDPKLTVTTYIVPLTHTHTVFLTLFQSLSHKLML